MTTIAYEPPERMYADTLLAFKDFEMASTWSARIDPDPLGPVNKIVSIWRGNRRVKAGLAHVPTGATVKLIREPGGFTLGDLMLLSERLWDSRGYRVTNGIPEPRQLPPRRAPGWYIEVDGREALYATDAEVFPSAHTPQPPKIRHRATQGLKRWLQTRARSATDAVAHRFGYIPADEAGDW